MPRRHNNKGRTKGSGRFVMLDYYILESAAFVNLTPNGRSGLIEVLRQYNGLNNGFIGMGSRRLAKRLNCSIATAARTLIELEDAGFIHCMSMGSFKLKNRRESEYRLEMHKCDRTGERASKRFMEPIAGLSHARDNTVSKTIRPPTKNAQQSCQRDRKLSSAPNNSLTTDTPIDIYHRMEAPEITGQVIPFPEIPAFLDRRGKQRSDTR